jgi:hypothetical protein
MDSLQAAAAPRSREDFSAAWVHGLALQGALGNMNMKVAPVFAWASVQILPP